MRRVLLVLTAGVVLVVAYPASLAFQIWQQSRRDELPGRAGAIVVLGAAQYNGKPSPVFKARLDHAAYLYGRDLSQIVVVTGGKRAGDEFSEAGAGQMYLEGSKEIPSHHVLMEEQGKTTLQSLRNMRQIVDDHGVRSLLLVSDPLHSERVKRIAHDLGFEPVYASPVSYLMLRRTRSTKATELAREVASLAAYELFGVG